MRRYLVFVRAGDDSLHPRWIEGARERTFDLFVSCYGSAGDRFREHADFWEAVPGFKWPRLAKLVVERSAWFAGYDACWFADDDLDADSATLDRMFDLFSRHDLWLAQPALAPGSYLSHPLTAQVQGSELRFTEFVEVMGPVFARSALARLSESFGESVSGWGLDLLWPHLLGRPLDKIAVLDAAAVVHTRAVGSGLAYRRYKELGMEPSDELRRILRRYGLSRRVRQ